MQSEPLISVIIPVYNNEIQVGAAVAGVLSQSYRNTEVVVVNDGSTDRTAAVLAGFGDLIRVIDQPNAGVSAARNAGAAAASADYLAFVDADDIPLPGYLAAMMESLQTSGPGQWWVYTQAYFLSSTGIDTRRPVVYGGPFPANRQREIILQRNIVGPTAALVPAQMHREIGGFDPGIRSCEDWDYWARAIFHGWYAVLQEQPHYLYRWTEGSLSGDYLAMLAGEDQVMQKLHDQHGESMTAAERDYLERRLRLGSPNRLTLQANTALRKGDFAQATELFRQAASLTPFDRKLQLKTKSMQWLPPARRYWRARRLAADRAMRRYDYSAQDAQITRQGDE